MDTKKLTLEEIEDAISVQKALIDTYHGQVEEIKKREHAAIARLDNLNYQKALLLYPAPPYTKVLVEWVDENGYHRQTESFLDTPKPSGFGKPYRMAFLGVKPDGTMSPRIERRFRPDQVTNVKPLKNK